MNQDVKIIVSNAVIKRMTALPAAVQSKGLEFMLKFQTDPRSPGINYERIQGAKDKNLRSVRIDQAYRGIIFQAPKDNVFIWLHVDQHDDAYQWASTRKMSVNPVNGALTLTNLNFVEETVQRRAAPTPSEPDPVFAGLSDRDLMAVGVPEEMLPAVRTIRSEGDLDAMREELPVEAYEGLFLLLAGDSVSSILSARETRVDREIDTHDFASAADRDESRSRFYLVEGEQDLQAILSAPLEQWRVFLHPTQRRLATRNLNGPSRILGGAGTGKTVLAMHRAKHLAGNLAGNLASDLANHGASGDQKLLFTTFTTNLALDIEDGLKSICSPEQMRRIDVINLDALVFRLLKARRYEHEIAFDFEAQCASIWEAAMVDFDPGLGVSRAFVREEFEQVVLAQGLATRDDYREAPRRGRGVLLSRKKRDALWEIFEDYRLQLSAKGLKEPDDAYRDACHLLEDESRPPYTHAVVDETQDFGPQALKLIRALVPPGANDLMFVGDGHQRIYAKNKAIMSRCGIDIRGRAKKLYLNYRTTEEIRLEAVSMLENLEVDDLDGGSDEIARYRSLLHGPVPEHIRGAPLERIRDGIRTFIAGCLDEYVDAKVGVMAPTGKLRDQLAKQIREAGYKVATVNHRERLSRKDAQIFAMTLHRAKGLEFDAVVILVNRELDDELRKLVYVGMTRAKRAARLYSAEGL